MNNRLNTSEEAFNWMVLIGLIFEVIFLRLIWNYLMPYLFGLPTITLWQSFLMNMLAGILFTSSNSYLRLCQITQLLRDR